MHEQHGLFSIRRTLVEIVDPKCRPPGLPGVGGDLDVVRSEVEFEEVLETLVRGTKNFQLQLRSGAGYAAPRCCDEAGRELPARGVR